jgi:hypothetical protein
MSVKTAQDNEELEKIFNEGEVGDLIDYTPDNQEGLVHYEIMEKNGKKELTKIGDYWSDMTESSSSIKGGKKSRSKKLQKKSYNKNGTLRKIKRPCCQTTLEGLNEWHDTNFKELGWMVLAKIHNNTEKVKAYLHSIKDLENAINLRLSHIHDADNKHDLEVMLHNSQVLCRHAEKILK